MTRIMPYLMQIKRDFEVLQEVLSKVWIGAHDVLEI